MKSNFAFQVRSRHQPANCQNPTEQNITNISYSSRTFAGRCTVKVLYSLPQMATPSLVRLETAYRCSIWSSELEDGVEKRRVWRDAMRCSS
jgi:hypothetical protein